MKKTMYLTVNVSEGNAEHIGTMKITSAGQIEGKLKEMLDSHFDANVEVKNDTPFQLEDFLYGRTVELKVKVDSEIDSIEEIIIQETWLY
jgi:hypothetical protein